MNYYKFTYNGRNSMGCNTYQYHSAVVPGEDEKEAVKMLDLKVKEINKNSNWPHELISIIDIEEVDQLLYNEWVNKYKRDKEKEEKISKLNAILSKWK